MNNRICINSAGVISTKMYLFVSSEVRAFCCISPGYSKELRHKALSAVDFDGLISSHELQGGNKANVGYEHPASL